MPVGFVQGNQVFDKNAHSYQHHVISIYRNQLKFQRVTNSQKKTSNTRCLIMVHVSSTSFPSCFNIAINTGPLGHHFRQNPPKKPQMGHLTQLMDAELSADGLLGFDILTQVPIPKKRPVFHPPLKQENCAFDLISSLGQGKILSNPITMN